MSIEFNFMNNIHNLSFIFFLFILFTTNINAQKTESPWSISVGADLINLQGNNVDSGLNFGAPSLGLSRYIGAGFSIGVQYGLNNVKNNTDAFNYTSLDGILKYNLTSGKILPYLFAGYGISIFSDGVEKEGIFPSGESGRTTSGGLGINIPINDKLNINLSSSYRRSLEINDSFNHLQHIIGLSYNFGSGDADKDGVSDKKDDCPNIPGLKEYNGCPDSDGDTIIDKEDKCPKIAGILEFNGCLDTDGDGISDPDDECPKRAGLIELSGCPDSDGDGVSDPNDECIYKSGPIENSGCPWPDADGDGIYDKDDLCVDEVGTIENKGCPELSSEIIKTLNQFGSRINFAANSNNIYGKKNFEVLNNIVKVLNENLEGGIIIEGYSSSDGEEKYNIELSIMRAESIRDYLIYQGISLERIKVLGLGESTPISDNGSPEGRASNRRVQFKPKRE